MTKKNLIGCLLALAMVLPLVACGGAPANTSSGNTATEAPKTDATEAPAADGEATKAPEEGTSAQAPTPAEFTIFIMDPAKSTVSPNDSVVGKKLQELTGVNLKYEFLVGTDVRQKASLMIAGGDYPDMINSSDASGDFISAEAFVPLNDYIEKSTYMKNCYKPYEIELLKNTDGNVYFISTGHANEDRVYPSAGYYVSMDLLKQNNYPIIKDFQQWQDLIIDYVKKNPTINGNPTIGYTGPSEGWRASALQYGGSRFLAGYPNDGLTVVDQETLEAKIIMYQDFQKEYFKMINRMWNEGVADKEMFMQTNDQYNAKIASGAVVGLYDQRSMFIDALNSLEGAGLTDYMLVAFPVTLPGVDRERYRGPRVFSAGSGLSITTSCKDPDRAFEFLDRICADDAQTLLRWGIEGVDYTVADGKYTRSKEQWDKANDPDYQKSQGLSTHGHFNFKPNLETFPNGSFVDPTKEENYAELRYKDYEKAFLANYADRNINNFCDFFNPSYDSFYEPGYNIRQKIPTDNPSKQAGETALEITREYVAKIAQVKPEQFDAIWDEFVAKLNALPLKEYEELATQMEKDSAKLYQMK